MSKYHLATLVLCLLAVPAGAGRDVEESRTLEEELRFAGPAAENLLVVDNVFGSIRVTAHDADTVRMVAREVVHARSADDLARARDEAGLEVETAGATIRLVVDGPFRTRDRGIQWHGDLGYELFYDFEIQVPRRTRLELRTINDGDVTVHGVEGDFDVSNVNGAIEMKNIAGHGRARTVNGGVELTFTRRPQGDCDFKTVNGDVDVTFPADLAADLRFKTFNGEVYTDFDYVPVAIEQPAPVRRGGRTTWKSLGPGARVGGGGPEISFDTLNGNVYIRNVDR
jgi:hypothetical protein